MTDRVVRVKEETWVRLQRWAIPLEDSADDVISRVLDVAERAKPGAEVPSPSASVIRLTSRLTGKTNSKRGPLTVDVLAHAGIIRPGTEVVLLGSAMGEAVSAGSSLWRAKIGDSRKFVWEPDSRSYTPNELTDILRTHGANFNQGAVNAFKYWTLATDRKRSLWDIREDVLSH